MEIYADRRVIALDDYRSVTIAGGRQRGWRSTSIEKGHTQELVALADCLRDGKPWPISLEEQVRAMRIAFDVQDILNR